MTEASPPLKSWNDLDGPPGLPIAGNLFQIRLDALHRIFERWADRYGRLYRVRIGPVRLAVVSDPDAIKRMLRERPGLFRRTRALEAVVAEMKLKGVFASEGEDWLRQRKLVVRALNTAHLRTFFPKLVVIAGRLRRRWEHAADTEAPVDLCRDLMRMTVDSVTGLAFGVDFNTLETPGPVIQQNMDKVLPMIHRRVNAAFPYWRYLRLPEDRALDRSLAQLQAQVDEILQEVRERMRANPSLRTSPTNFLEAILAAASAGKLEITDDEIVANVCNLLLAGEDTTAHTIAWTVDYLIRYPEHFARARAEVDAVLGPAASVEHIKQTDRFPFLDAFFHEAMRLKPVAPVNVLEPTEDVEMVGCLIPKGTPIFGLTRHIATRDEHFGDADRFDPERWLEDDGAQRQRAHDTSTFLPFGGGPRFCPGRNFALLQIRIVLAMLCRNFDLTLADPKRPVEERFAFTMMPTGMVVRIRRRAERG